MSYLQRLLAALEAIAESARTLAANSTEERRRARLRCGRSQAQASWYCSCKPPKQHNSAEPSCAECNAAAPKWIAPDPALEDLT